MNIRLARESEYDHLCEIEIEIEIDAAQIFRSHGLDSVDDGGTLSGAYYRSLSFEALILVALDSDKIIGFAVGIIVDGHALC